MASSSSNPCLADEEINTCPICSELFDSPKILPRCGHTFCINCLKRIWTLSNDNSIRCPECRTESYLSGLSGPEELPTNYHARRTVDAFKEAKAASEAHSGDAKISSTEFCSHAAQMTVSCRHCGQKFCDSCLVGHKERMKFDIIWQGSELDERIENLNAGLDECVMNLSNSLKDQGEHLEKEIMQECETFQQAVISAVAEHCVNLIERVREITRSERILVTRSIDSAKVQQAMLSRNITELGNKSILHCTHEELLALHDKLNQLAEKEISELEAFKRQKDIGKFAFNPLETLDSEAILLRLTAPIPDNVLNWKKPPPPPSTTAEDRLSKESRLHLTAKTGNIDKLKEILHRKGLSPACKQFLIEHRDRDDFNRTLLIQAAMHGHIDFVRYLVFDCDADIHAAGNDEQELTAIHLAAENGHVEVVRFLVVVDPNLVDVKNKWHVTPLALAAKSSQIGVIKFLIEEKKADLECRSELGRTPLLFASTMKNLPLVKLLVEKGADLTAKDENGDTAAHIAVNCGHTELAKYLIDSNPRVLWEKNNNGQTPFKLAKLQKKKKSMAWIVFFKQLKNL